MKSLSEFPTTIVRLFVDEFQSKIEMGLSPHGDENFFNSNRYEEWQEHTLNFETPPKIEEIKVSKDGKNERSREGYCSVRLRSVKVRGPELGGLGFIRELAQHVEDKNELVKTGPNELQPKQK